MLGERLKGLLLILAGSATLVLVSLAQQHLATLIRPPAPPGLPTMFVPLSSPFAWLLPMIGLGAVGLCLLGIRKLLFPENWDPPKHRD